MQQWYSFVEVSRTRTDWTTRIFTEDYTTNPSVCRGGVWVGLRREFVETVVLSIDPSVFQTWPWIWVGWRVDGIPLYSTHVIPTSSRPYVQPVYGHPSVTAQVPVGPYFDRIAFTSSKGADEECFSVQVLWSPEAQFPFQRGDTKRLCITGTQVRYPTFRLEEEEQCVGDLRDFLDRFEFIPPDPPGPPIERSLGRLRGDDARRVRAYMETLDRMDPDSEKDLFDEISAELRAFVHWAAIQDSRGFREDEPRLETGATEAGSPDAA